MRSCRACAWQVDIPTDWAYEGQGRVGAGQAGNCDLCTLVLEDWPDRQPVRAPPKVEPPKEGQSAGTA